MLPLENRTLYPPHRLVGLRLWMQMVTLCLKSQDIEEKLLTYNRNVFIPLPSQTESSTEYVAINIILLMNFAEFFSIFPIIFIDLLLLLRYFDKKYRVSSCIGFEMLFNNYFRKISMEN